MYKTKKLEVRMGEQLLSDLKTLADIEKTTVSEYIRRLISTDRDYKYSTEGIDELSKKHEDKIKEINDIAKNKIKELETELNKWKGVLVP